MKSKTHSEKKLFPIAGGSVGAFESESGFGSQVGATMGSESAQFFGLEDPSSKSEEVQPVEIGERIGESLDTKKGIPKDSL